MWSATGAMVAYVWWALGTEGVYAMAALITTGVLANTATTSYIAPVDLSERPSVGAGRGRPALSAVGPGADVEAGLHAIEAGSSSYYDYSDDDAFYDEYADDEPVLAVAIGGTTAAASVIPSATTTRPRPRPGRMRSAAMRTLLLNLFLHNAVLFLYDVTSVLARLEDTESAPVVRRALVLSNLASVWYRAGQALFHYRKYNFAWRNVMIPQFEAAPITAR
nr:hypothetical protein [Pandoravirus belohorizontensis]